MLKSGFRLVVGLVGVAVWYWFQLEISQIFSPPEFKNKPATYAASVHFPLGFAAFSSVSLEKKPVSQPRESKIENLILLTLDGFRWQELFAGADSSLLNDPEFVADTASLRRLFGADSPAGRRQKLMPFFWETIARDGQVYGNRWLESRCEVTNSWWFSYPGYAEMLCGFTDGRINSNRKVNNPNPTVFDFLNQSDRFRGRVAVFGSWDVFPAIYNESRAGFPVNAGIEPPEGCANSHEKDLAEGQVQHPSPWPGVRNDWYTFQLGLEFLKKNRPHLFAFHFDGTDDSAHDGRYDDYLAAANQVDDFLRILWNFIQNDPDYRDRTALVIGTDHGRGAAKNGGWKKHGRLTKGSNEIWMAFIGPDIQPLGEVRGPHPVLFQKQIAPTIAALLGHHFRPDEEEPGEAIRSLFREKEFVGLLENGD